MVWDAISYMSLNHVAAIREGMCRFKEVVVLDTRWHYTFAGSQCPGLTPLCCVWVDRWKTFWNARYKNIRNEFFGYRGSWLFMDLCIICISSWHLWWWDFIISEATLSFWNSKIFIHTNRQAGGGRRYTQTETQSFETAFSAEWISLPLHFSSEHISLVNCLAHSIF